MEINGHKIAPRASLRWADLREAKLYGADLYGANLYGANLREADLRWANLREADLREADLRWADLREASLRGANLHGANLREADLHGASLHGALDVPDEARLLTQIVPDEGAFVAWKKLGAGRIAKLRVPASAKRSNATARKCRASKAKVLAIYDRYGTECAPDLIAESEKGGKYQKGKMVTPHEWCEDRWKECAGGIHFFITRAEAERY